LTLAATGRAFLADARRATLATIAPDGHARLVPICLVLIEDVVWSPLDEKPKSTSDLLDLARVRDITRDPRVTLLVDRWSEDWSELGWLRVEGSAAVVESDPSAVEALRAKYPQYRGHDLESRPMIRITIEHASSWAASSADGDAPGRTDE
jgi:PPOX class probable F420-dependent enzyme